MEMTAEVLRTACKKNGGYAQPHLNDQLFLQCRGFTKIENLEPYVNLKVLWLEQNGIMDIEGLATLERLVSLFLHNNTIRRISGLSGLRNLRILNLSHNFISKVEGLADTVPLLETLQLSHNQLSSLDACGELQRLECLSSIDLSFNKVERDPEAPETATIDFFAAMQQVTVLYLHGNPVTHGMRNYRKRLVAAMRQLTYLDERPVFPDERAATDAWAAGGAEAEKAAREAIRREKLDHLNSCVNVMQRMAAEKREIKEQREREWAEQCAAREERERNERARRRALFNGVENEEDDARGALLVAEADAWLQLDVELADAFADAQVDAAKAASLRAVREEVDRELRAEEEKMVRDFNNREAEEKCDDTHGSRTDGSKLAVSSPSKSAAAADAAESGCGHENEMSKWVRELEKSDEEVVQQMQADLEGLLRELQPGLAPPVAVVTARSAAVTHVDPNASIEKKLAPPAAAATALPRRDRFAVWERFYAFEQRAAAKRKPV